MERINVYDYPPNDLDPADNDEPSLAGWFDADKALMVSEDTEWNGYNHISVHTRSQWDHQVLYRTAKGRWVLHRWSQRQGSTSTYEFLSDEQAKQWLTVNGSDDVIAEYFGELEEESGPATIGRPKSYGDPFPQRLDPDVQAEVDRRAKDAGVSRAEMVRRLVAAGIAGQGTQAHRLDA